MTTLFFWWKQDFAAELCLLGCVCAQSASGQLQSWPSLVLIRLGAIIPALPYKCTDGIKWPQRPACHKERALVCRLSWSRETHRVHCYSYHLRTVFYVAFFTSLHAPILQHRPPLHKTLSLCPSEDKTTLPRAFCGLLCGDCVTLRNGGLKQLTGVSY